MLFQIYHTLLQHENLKVFQAKLTRVEPRLNCLSVPSMEILIEGLSLVLLGGGGELKEAGLLGEEDIDATIEGLLEFKVIKICSNLYFSCSSSLANNSCLGEQGAVVGEATEYHKLKL